jgi:UDP-N-acetylmuramate dehydrogenase
MQIEHNYDLTLLNTFGVKASAKFFAEITREEDLKPLFQSQSFKENEKLFMGGGSNVLFVRDFPGIVVLNKIKGMEILKEDNENAWIKAYSGETWHDLVVFSVKKGFWGIENLSLIPGTVGGAPVQNIGAYGVELKETLENIETLDIETGEKKEFTEKECNFGYRDSIFKKEAKGKYFILSLTLKLSKKPKPNISYRVLRDFLEKNKTESLSSEDISEAVSQIRKSKLPDPKLIGNAGSFFKNVFVDSRELESLKRNFPDIPTFEEEGKVKIPAGWLIEKCGWKGKRLGNVGVHEKQALVLVNYGGAKGEEILDLSRKITDSVYLKFGLKLSPEVNIV